MQLNVMKECLKLWVGFKWFRIGAACSQNRNAARTATSEETGAVAESLWHVLIEFGDDLKGSAYDV
jgi:hypothetical protein